MSTYYDEVQELKGRYPDWRSATLPALRLAQEKHGYLSPDALRECANALGTTPAYCESVASFYDMFHLRPVGRHMIEVCTNISCALNGAQQVLEAFSRETSGDDEFTVRPVECMGGCGWATIVATDEHYRTRVTVDDVPRIVEELRNGA